MNHGKIHCFGYGLMMDFPASRLIKCCEKPLVWKISYESTREILVGGLEHFLFLHILGIMIPTD
jgi:hypothetical protein